MVKIFENFSNFKLLVISVATFNIKTFCEHKLIKKIKKKIKTTIDVKV